MTRDQQIQKKYIQGQLLKQHIASMVEQKNVLDEKIAEMSVSLDALERMDELKKGGEIWSSVGSGTFFRSDIKDTDSVMISIGAGIVIRKSREQASVILKKRIEEIRKLDLELMEEATKYASQLEEIEQELQELVQEDSRKGKK